MLNKQKYDLFQKYAFITRIDWTVACH